MFDESGRRIAAGYVRRILVSDDVRWNVVRRGLMTPLPPAAPAAMDEDVEACAICAEELVNEIAMIPCGHRFHGGCLVRWTRRQRTCPMCRRVL